MPSILNSAVPGFDKLTASASSIIDNALSGTPSTASSRLENAWYGAGSGMDSRSGFLKNRGYDLYRREADDRQQQGLGNLLKLISTYSGTVVPTTGQQLQDQQFQQQFSRQQRLDSQGDYIPPDPNAWERGRADTIASNPLNLRFGAGGSPTALESSGAGRFFNSATLRRPTASSPVRRR